MLALIDLVEDELLPPFFAAGFERAESYPTDPRGVASARQILLVREVETDVDEVVVNFDKYRRPRFQIHLSRRNATPPNAWVRAANVVARRGQHLHFWGKPVWLPAALWSEQRSKRTVGRVLTRIEQALSFLTDGKPGPAIAISGAR